MKTVAERARVLFTRKTNPYANLAAEEAMLLNCRDTITLFLWQNQHTVVIGASQNAWRECDTALLEREGGRLARRCTGGGAVYHDLGNLNFSFIMPRAEYDPSRTFGVVRSAVRSLGIDAELTGRNDLTAQGRKFSGSAFRLLKEGALHHGTLLVRADMAKIGRYLTVDPAKLAAKGVRSVRSRVCNLCDLAPVTVKDAARALEEAFRAAFGGGEASELDSSSLPGWRELLARNESWAWNYARSPEGDWHGETRFAWGGLEIYLHVRSGLVSSAQVFTDAMDETLAGRLSQALTGARFDATDLSQRARAAGEADAAGWLLSLNL